MQGIFNYYLIASLLDSSIYSSNHFSIWPKSFNPLITSLTALVKSSLPFFTATANPLSSGIPKLSIITSPSVIEANCFAGSSDKKAASIDLFLSCSMITLFKSNPLQLSPNFSVANFY